MGREAGIVKIAINRCYGGFGLSDRAMVRLKELWPDCPDYIGMSSEDEIRANPCLVRVIEELGDEANGWHSSLSIVDVPDGIEWEICEYDGLENVAEKHREWR